MRIFIVCIAALIGSSCSFSPPPPPGQALLEEGAQLFDRGEPAAAAEVLARAIEAGVERPADAESALGNALAASGDLDGALAHHQRAVALDPDHHRAWVNLGVVQRQQGAYADASASYDRAEALAPDYPELHASRGALLLLQGKEKAAEASLRRAIALDDSLAVAHANLAVTLVEQGRDDEAELALQAAIARGYPRAEVLRERTGLVEGVSSPASPPSDGSQER